MNNTFKEYRKEQVYDAYQWDGDLKRFISEIKKGIYRDIADKCTVNTGNNELMICVNGTSIINFVNVGGYFTIYGEPTCPKIECYTESDFDDNFIEV